MSQLSQSLLGKKALTGQARRDFKKVDRKVAEAQERAEVLAYLRKEVDGEREQRRREEKEAAEKEDRMLWHTSMTESIKTSELNISWKKIIVFNKGVFTMEKDFGMTLKCLRLVGCGLEEIPQQLGTTLLNLEILQLSSNRIKFVPENLSCLTNLKELGLLSNNIEMLHSKIGLMCSLSKLEIANNRLTKLPDSFAALSKLDRVVLENNLLTILPENLEAMFCCRTLNISNNQLLRLPRCIGRMPSLTTLNASNNQIAYIPNEIVSNKSLKYIRLNRNKISQLPGRIGELRKLVELSVDYNMIGNLPVSFYNLTRLKILRVEGNLITSPPEDIIALGGPAVVDWCRKRFLKDETFRMRQIISATQILLENIVSRDLYDRARFEPNTIINRDPWYSMDIEHLFDDLIPTIAKIWHKEATTGNIKRNGMYEYPFTKKDLLWAFTTFCDTSGPVMLKQKSCFRRCQCKDETGRRKPCVPPKTGFMCYRMCTLLKGNLVLKQLKADRIWDDYRKKGIEDAVERANVEATKYLNSAEGSRWLMQLSFERAEDLLLERGAGKALKWRDVAAERKKRSIVKKYDKLILRIQKKRDKKLAIWNKDLAELNEKVKTAREGYMKIVTDAKITDLTTKIADIEENVQIRNLQVECEEQCKLVEQDIFDDGSSSESSVDSEVQRQIDEGIITKEFVESLKKTKEKIVEYKPKGQKSFYDQFNKSYYSQARELVFTKLQQNGFLLDDATWEYICEVLKNHKKKMRKSLDLMEIRFSKLFHIYAGDFNELQKEMKYELYYQYIQNEITTAKRKAEKEYDAFERIRENWGGASLRKSFNGWRDWVKDKLRRQKRDLRYHWRVTLRGFEAAMQSVLIAEAQANLWEKCADVYSDHIFYTNTTTGDISWERPTIATYLPPGFVIPDPPDPLPPGISIDSTSSDSEREDSAKRITRKKKKRNGVAANIKGTEELVVKGDDEDSEADEADDEDEELSCGSRSRSRSRSSRRQSLNEESGEDSEEENGDDEDFGESDDRTRSSRGIEDIGDDDGVPYLVYLHKIACRELVNVEMGSLSFSFSAGIGVKAGKNDPYVQLAYGSWFEKTDHIDEAGDYAVWENLGYVFKTNEKELYTESLLCQIYDHNDVSNDEFIGNASVSISDIHASTEPDKAYQCDFEIFDLKGKKSGSVSLYFSAAIDDEALEQRAHRRARAERARANKEAFKAKFAEKEAKRQAEVDALTLSSQQDEGITNLTDNAAFLSLDRKFTYPGAPRKWPALKPIAADEIVEAEPSDDKIYGATVDSVYAYGPDSLRAALPGKLASRPLFGEIELPEGTGLDLDMERRLNNAKKFMQTEEYSKYSVIKSNKVISSSIVLKDSKVSKEAELDAAMEFVKRKRMAHSGARKNLYLRQLVRRERSFETIKARRAKPVKEEKEAYLPDGAELLELVGGNQSLMAESNADAMKIRTLLAKRALKAKQKFREKAVSQNLAKPKEYSFWSKNIAPIWREDYIPSSGSDEDDDNGKEGVAKVGGAKNKEEDSSGSDA